MRTRIGVPSWEINRSRPSSITAYGRKRHWAVACRSCRAPWKWEELDDVNTGEQNGKGLTVQLINAP